ncbi:MAG: Rrf2 family transcriptional regulator [Thermoanaerobaculia bacterium]|jgi:Rrf2 family protein
MSTNSRFAVAVHSLVALAYMGGSATSEQLACNTVNTNPVVLRRILARLVRAGILEAQAGKSGGFRLAREPRSIDLASVWMAVEDGGVFGIHENAAVPSCPVSSGIKPLLSEVLEEAETALQKSLSGRKLSELLGRIQANERSKVRRR